MAYPVLLSIRLYIKESSRCVWHIRLHHRNGRAQSHNRNRNRNRNRKQILTFVNFVNQQQDNRTQDRASINVYGPSQTQARLPPASDGPPPNKPSDGYQQRRKMDNRPAWKSKEGYEIDKPGRKRQVDFDVDETKNKNGRLFAFLGKVLVSTTAARGAPMPLDVDNGLPGIEMRFGKTDETEVTFICHVDTCAAMSTGNLKVHEWIMTTYPSIVAEYIQYNDDTPFEPIQLSCAVQDLDKVQSEHGNLTAIVRYWTRYKIGNTERHMLLSFGLGAGVAVNTIIGLPTLRQWGSNIDLVSDMLTAPELKKRFKLHYEPTQLGVPKGIAFDRKDFERPGPIRATALITNLGRNSAAITDGCDYQNHECKVTDITDKDYLCREVDISHLN